MDENDPTREEILEANLGVAQSEAAALRESLVQAHVVVNRLRRENDALKATTGVPGDE